MQLIYRIGSVAAAAVLGMTALLRRHHMRGRRRKRNILVLGIGNMGKAAVFRLLEKNHKNICIWNRSPEKAKDIRGVRFIADLSTALSVVAKEEESIILLLLSTIDVARKLLLTQKNRPLLLNSKILNMISSSPTAAQGFAKEMIACGVRSYVDACYAGTPALLRSGEGMLLASSNSCIDPSIRNIMQTLGGTVHIFKGQLGCAKAVDYAIVDMYFANMLFFLNGIGLCESEGVTAEEFLNLVRLKLPTYARTFSNVLSRLHRRDYESQTTATVSTWLRFFESRVPYLRERKISQELCDVAIKMLSREAEDGGASKDIYVLQERLRFNCTRACDHESPI